MAPAEFTWTAGGTPVAAGQTFWLTAAASQRRPLEYPLVKRRDGGSFFHRPAGGYWESVVYGAVHETPNGAASKLATNALGLKTAIPIEWVVGVGYEDVAAHGPILRAISAETLGMKKQPAA